MRKNILYENVIENTTDGILIIGFDGRIRMENDVASEILDVNPDFLQGKTIAALMDANEENDEFFRAIIDAIYEKKKISEAVEYYRKDGRRYLHVITSFLKNKKEDIELIVVISDITELVELGHKNKYLTDKLISFLDHFVKVMIDAIDKRTPYNANHTRNMVRYAENYLRWLDTQGRGIDEGHRNMFLFSVWMHDVGKLVIPTEIMNKPTRLGDQIKDVMHRIETATLCERLEVAEGREDASAYEAKVKELSEAKTLIQRMNHAGFASEEDKEKLREAAKISCLTSFGERLPLLSEDELAALSVTKGTLTAEDRKIMESHATHTREMLEKLEVEGAYKNTPIWAGGHHEYLDGSGYPKGLSGDDITWEMRLLTIIDIYDALTAEDRPYKPPVSPEKAFFILEDMVKEGKLDAEILADFKASEAWKHTEEETDSLLI